MRGWLRRTACAVGLVLAVTAGCSADPSHRAAAPVASAGSTAGQPAPHAGEQPGARVPLTQANIVVVLLDDMSMELLQTMPNVARMLRRGAAYDRSFVVDSLCCVSRSSLLTGQYPHQTGVRTNTANLPNAEGPVGGFTAFREYGNERRAVNVRLQEAGYRTGFVGKFLNEYEPGRGTGLVPAPPPGWDEWNVLFGSAYDGWDFTSSHLDDGRLRLRHHPAPPTYAPDEEKDAAYAGTVTEELALDFLRERQPRRAPYFLVVAPYAPHGRVNARGHYPGDPLFPPAFRDRRGPGKGLGNCGLVPCSELTVADLPGYGDDPADNVPRRADGSLGRDWRAGLGSMEERVAVAQLRDRARMLQSADRMLGRILESVDEETYVVLTSDNGFHLGQHHLAAGKGAPYATDTQVPLVVVGPGVRPGVRDELVSNIDLAPTFEEIAGLRPATYRSGRSVLASLRGEATRERDVVVLEHTWGPTLRSDPDLPPGRPSIEHIPSYVAARSATGLLVRVDLDNDPVAQDLAWEFYDLTAAAYERVNAYGDPAHAAEVGRLRAAIERFDRCSVHVRDDAVPASCR